MDVGAQSIEGFLDEMASESVGPAGGSAVATTGAMAAALCEMACVHTLEKDPEVGPIDPGDLRDQLRTERGQLLELAGQDAQVIERVFSDTRPDPTPSETERMLGIPVSIAEAGLAVIELGSTVVAGVDGAVVADAKTGVHLADASFEGALRIVTSNLSGASDTSFVEQIEERVTDLVDDRDRIAAETPDSVLSDPPGR